MDGVILKVFPNPVQNDAICELQGLADGSRFSIELLNLQGKVISCSNFSGNGQHVVSLRGLPAGAYYLKTVTSGKVITNLIIKN
jgi:hypothetical protein